MSLTIRFFAAILFLASSTISIAQDQEKTAVEGSVTASTDRGDNRFKVLTLSIGAYAPIASGDKFVGQGFEGKFGFEFKAQVMVYKQFFISFEAGQTYFDVVDISRTGNFRSSVISNQHISVGYEFLPIQKVRVGLGVGVLGRADYSNNFRNGLSTIQRDTAKLNIYELYIDYEVFDFMALTLNYAYRNDKTKIDVPQELQSSFDRAQFQTVGLGLKFYIGDSNLFH